MKTHYIISTESDINLINDAAYIRPNLLFFDHLKNSSYCAFHIMIYRAIDDIEYEKAAEIAGNLLNAVQQKRGN